jgi:hypothetical protein
MSTRRPTETTSRGWLARRLLIAPALALVMTMAAAGTALAASGHASVQQRSAPAAAQVKTPAADEPAAHDNRSYPMVPLVFAGILILAVASPTLPRYYSRYGYYQGERW